MSSDYFKNLDLLTAIRYEEKLKVGSVDLPDPLDSDVREMSFNYPNLP